MRQVPYSGPNGVEKVLSELSSKHGWEQILEDERIIALKNNELDVTLEPGGAIEFVSSPVKNLSVLEDRINDFYSILKEICEPKGVKVLQYGRLPFDDLEDVKLVPKSRYQFMYPYMETVGERGQEMMKLTSSVQVSIDFETEEDATKKLRLAAQATPFFIALSANSSFKNGEFLGVASDRANIWQYTDESRSGLPEFMFNKKACFSAYVNWALDIPIYFLVRGDEKYTGGGVTFREYLDGKSPIPAGITPEKPTRGDWEQHLSTLFPWVRFRHYIEIRAFDMGPLPLQLAAGAICKVYFTAQKQLPN